MKMATFERNSDNNNIARAFADAPNMQDLNPNPPMKQNVMIFRKNRVYVSLDLKSYYDSAKGRYGEPSPKLTSSANGVFYNLPADSEFLKDYGGFILKLADALDGIVIDNSVINDDVGNAKRMLQRFKGAK